MSKFPKKKYRISMPGMYRIYCNAEVDLSKEGLDISSEVLQGLVQEGMHTFFPPRKTWSYLCAELAEDWIRSDNMSCEFQSLKVRSLIATPKCSAICIGPVPGTKLDGPKYKDQWSFLSEVIADNIFSFGMLIAMNVVVHNNGDRSIIEWHVVDEDESSDAEKETMPSDPKKFTNDTQVDPGQKCITDFFRRSK